MAVHAFCFALGSHIVGIQLTPVTGASHSRHSVYTGHWGFIVRFVHGAEAPRRICFWPCNSYQGGFSELPTQFLIDMFPTGLKPVAPGATEGPHAHPIPRPGITCRDGKE